MTTATPNSNFLKGVKWSPDGMCFITASDDNWCGEWLEGACCGAGPASSQWGSGVMGQAVLHPPGYALWG